MDAKWRWLWMSLAAGTIASPTVATEWIRAAADAIPADAWNERFTLAQAWHQLGDRLADKDATMVARDLLRGLIDHPSSCGPLLFLASLDADAGETSSGGRPLSPRLEGNPNLAEAQNNLAYILLTRNGDLTEAKDLATRAVALAPTIAAFHDTLARINEKLDNRNDALTEFQEALRLDPGSVDARIGLSRVLRAAGSRDKAAAELQRIDTQLNGNPPSSESTRRELQNLRESLSSSTTAE